MASAWYNAYTSTRHWKELRRDAHAAHNHACVACGSKLELACYHLTYERIGGELPTDVTVLCKSCHGVLRASGEAIPFSGTIYAEEPPEIIWDMLYWETGYYRNRPFPRGAAPPRPAYGAKQGGTLP